MAECKTQCPHCFFSFKTKKTLHEHSVRFPNRSCAKKVTMAHSKKLLCRHCYSQFKTAETLKKHHKLFKHGRCKTEKHGRSKTEKPERTIVSEPENLSEDDGCLSPIIPMQGTSFPDKADDSILSPVLIRSPSSSSSSHSLHATPHKEAATIPHFECIHCKKQYKRNFYLEAHYMSCHKDLEQSEGSKTVSMKPMKKKDGDHALHLKKMNKVASHGQGDSSFNSNNEVSLPSPSKKSKTTSSTEVSHAKEKKMMTSIHEIEQIIDSVAHMSPELTVVETAGVEEEETYACSKCSQVFEKQRKLEKHMRKKHRGGKMVETVNDTIGMIGLKLCSGSSSPELDVGGKKKILSTLEIPHDAAASDHELLSISPSKKKKATSPFKNIYQSSRSKSPFKKRKASLSSPELHAGGNKEDLAPLEIIKNTVVSDQESLSVSPSKKRKLSSLSKKNVFLEVSSVSPPPQKNTVLAEVVVHAENGPISLVNGYNAVPPFENQDNFGTEKVVSPSKLKKATVSSSKKRTSLYGPGSGVDGRDSPLLFSSPTKKLTMAEEIDTIIESVAHVPPPDLEVKETSAEEEEVQYSCTVCTRVFQKQRKLDKHMKKRHSDEENWDDELQFGCTICSKKYALSKIDRLESHLARHETEAYSVCFDCDGLIIMKFRKLKKHISKKHDQPADPLPREQDTEPIHPDALAVSQPQQKAGSDGSDRESVQVLLESTLSDNDLSSGVHTVADRGSEAVALWKCSSCFSVMESLEDLVDRWQHSHPTGARENCPAKMKKIQEFLDSVM